MGQGNIKYRKVKRTPQTGENAGKELWYATVVTDREMNFEEFVDHISSHNSPYSRGTVHGVMMDMLDCLKELILDGKSVRLGDLGLCSIGMSSHGEVSRDKVSAASVEGIHLLVKNTKTWSNSELAELLQLAVTPVLGIFYQQMDALHACRSNLVAAHLTTRTHADGEEPQVAQTHTLAVENQLLQAVEHIHHHAVHGASAVRRVVRRNVVHELLEVHLSVGNHGGIPELLTSVLTRLRGTLYFTILNVSLSHKLFSDY